MSNASKWLVLVEDEPFDRARNRVVTIDGAVVSDNAGKQGAVARVGDHVALTFPFGEEGGMGECLAFARFPADAERISGSYYFSFDSVPDGLRLLNRSNTEEAESMAMCQPATLIRDDIADAMFA